ncbi:hypothetical protein ACEXQD_12925 [Herbiconiux sp. P15]|uniref:hypothetical protein n=1 Tax=Herbiconiux liukaitaii TaxID=3342799 RepID=UPI0035B7714D
MSSTVSYAVDTLCLSSADDGGTIVGIDSHASRIDGLTGVLQMVFRDLASLDGYVDSGPAWVSFITPFALLDIEKKAGNVGILSVHAYLLDRTDGASDEDDVAAWIDNQPAPRLGLLATHTDEDYDSARPLLRFDIQTDSVVSEFVERIVAPFAEAWQEGTAVQLSPGDELPSLYRANPTVAEPRNAWLLIGDSASYPTPEELTEMADEGKAGIFDNDWTAPKNGELGDLVLFYFMAPRKAVHFVARLASQPFWDADVEVNAEAAVDPHQWWAYTTPLIEIAPISYEMIRAASHGYLNLKGRSGHYISPATVTGLKLIAARPDQQEDLDRVVKEPVGMAMLPEADRIGLEEWRNIPGGLLTLEAKVSEYVAGPIEALMYGAPDPAQIFEPTLGPFVHAEYSVPSGFVDFVYEYGGKPALAVEVKLTMIRPQSGVWIDSPDFQQLQRYMADLDTPGLLVDAQRILLVHPGGDEPFAEIVRAEATWDDVAMIRDLMIEGRARKTIIYEALHVPPRRVARRG